jgi:hypothetical protein
MTWEDYLAYLRAGSGRVALAEAQLASDADSAEALASAALPLTLVYTLPAPHPPWDEAFLGQIAALAEGGVWPSLSGEEG